MSVLNLLMKPKKMVDMFWFTVMLEDQGGKFHCSNLSPLFNIGSLLVLCESYNFVWTFGNNLFETCFTFMAFLFCFWFKFLECCFSSNKLGAACRENIKNNLEINEFDGDMNEHYGIV